jgi:homoserine kinase type II
VNVQFFSHTDLAPILKCWDLSIGKVHHEAKIQGSPERCRFRTVIEDQGCSFYLLENIAPEDRIRKSRIIKTLAFLHSKGMPNINPYLKSRGDEEIVNFRDSYWLLSRFVIGCELDRPAYVFEGWRGEVLGTFLVKLKAASKGLTFFEKTPVFSIKAYVEDLMEKLRTRKPEIFREILPVFHFLEKQFMNLHDELPIGFSHGDFHPLNVIWSENGVKAVIDWEFAGFKPELYDAALLLGCLGIEDPDSLFGEFAFRFLNRIQKAGVYSDSSMAFLAELTIAIRFAWLAEWLRKDDLEMVALECIFLDLLATHCDKMKKEWNTLFS